MYEDYVIPPCRQSAEHNAHNHSSSLLHYVGNGYIGLSVSSNSEINIKSRRTLR